MARFIIRLLLLIGVALAVLYALQLHAPGPPMPRALELPAHTVRIVVERRPADLPLYALHALLSDKANLEIRAIEQPGERWRLLAAGEADIVVGTLDEFALAVPRFNPGEILFPVALSQGADAVIAHEKAPSGPLRAAYVSGSPGEYLVGKMAADTRHAYGITPIPAPDAKTARAWYERGEVGALATSEPYLAGYLAKGDVALIRTSEKDPITQVWVVSHQAFRNERQPRITRQDIEKVAEAWFLLMAKLRDEPGLALGAIARDNEMQVSEVERTFEGTRFLTLREAQATTQESLLAQLDGLATRWALSSAFNAEKMGSFEGVVDLSILPTLKAPEAPIASPSPTVEPSPSAIPVPVQVPVLSPSPSPILEESPDPFSSPMPIESP